MDTDTAQLMAAVARVEEGVRQCREDIGRLHDHTSDQFGHISDQFKNGASRMDSLERTRDVQKGAGKLFAALAIIGGGGLTTYLKFWS